MAGRCCAVGLHAGVKGVGGPVTRGGQGKGRGPVRCASVVVAPGGNRSSGAGPGSVDAERPVHGARSAGAGPVPGGAPEAGGQEAG